VYLAVLTTDRIGTRELIFVIVTELMRDHVLIELVRIAASGSESAEYVYA
jgi:hypothetical protein